MVSIIPTLIGNHLAGSTVCPSGLEHFMATDKVNLFVCLLIVEVHLTTLSVFRLIGYLTEG